MGVGAIIQACRAEQEVASMALGAAFAVAAAQQAIVIALAADVAKFEVVVWASVQAGSFKIQIVRFVRLRVTISTRLSIF